jgi:hypothetical protein
MRAISIPAGPDPKEVLLRALAQEKATTKNPARMRELRDKIRDLEVDADLAELEAADRAEADAAENARQRRERQERLLAESLEKAAALVEYGLVLEASLASFEAEIDRLPRVMKSLCVTMTELLGRAPDGDDVGSRIRSAFHGRALNALSPNSGFKQPHLSVADAAKAIADNFRGQLKRHARDNGLDYEGAKP